MAVGTGIFFGLVPAIVSAKPELTEALKEGGRGSTGGAHHNRLRNALIVAETVLALVLLIGAGLLVKSFVRLQNVSPGFNPHNVLTAEISLPVEKYPRGLPVINFYKEAERRIKNIAGRSACSVYGDVAIERIEYGQLIHHRGPGSKNDRRLSRRGDS